MYQGSSMNARPHAYRAKLKSLAPLKDLRSDDESAMNDDDDVGSSTSSQLSRAVGTMRYQGSSMKARPHSDKVKLKNLTPLRDLRSDDETAIEDVNDGDSGSSMSSQLSRAVGTMMYQDSSMKARSHADSAKKLKSLVPLRDLRSDDESAVKDHYGLYQYPSRHSVDHISDALDSSPLADEPTVQRTDILGSSYVGMQQDVHDGGEIAVGDDLHGRKSASNIS
jgi:hypothetical protein